MLLRNKYRRWYLRLINSRRHRQPIIGEYYERHHILPKSIWSEHKSAQWNLVRLTAREHFVAHKLLVRCMEGRLKAKMQSALWVMVNTSDVGVVKSSSQYEQLRRDNASARAKSFKVYKDGKPIVITNLRQFCRDNDINDGNMFSLLTGRTKFCQGYTLTPERKPSKGKGVAYTVTKDGDTVEVDNLKQFCRDNDLSYMAFSNVVRGLQKSHKGYTIVKRNNGRVLGEPEPGGRVRASHDQYSDQRMDCLLREVPNL